MSAQICRLNASNVGAAQGTHFTHARLDPSFSKLTAVIAASPPGRTGSMHIASLPTPRFQANAPLLCHLGRGAHRIRAICEMLETCRADCERCCSEVVSSFGEKLDAMRIILGQHSSPSLAIEEDMLSLAITGLVRRD